MSRGVIEMRTILVIALLVAPTFADALQYTQDKKSEYSKVIEQDGEKKIVMPDGRIIPFGTGVICSDDCPEIAPPASRSRAWWLIPAAGAIITTLLLLPPKTPAPTATPSRPIDPPTATPTPHRDVPSRPIAPPVEVPEPATLFLLAGGLAMMARKLRPVLLILVFLSLPVFAGTTLRIDPTAIDGNRDGRDDFWRVAGNIGVADALFVPRVLIPINWIQPASALWVSNNNGGGSAESFSRRFILPENANLSAVEFGLEFSASGPAEIFINGKSIKAFDNAAPDLRIFAQAKGQLIYKSGENVLEVRVKGGSGLLGFLCLEGYVNYTTEPDTERTLHDYRRKGRA